MRQPNVRRLIALSKEPPCPFPRPIPGERIAAQLLARRLRSPLHPIDLGGVPAPKTPDHFMKTKLSCLETTLEAAHAIWKHGPTLRGLDAASVSTLNPIKVLPPP